MLVAAFLAPVAQQFVSDGVSLISPRTARCRRRRGDARACIYQVPPLVTIWRTCNAKDRSFFNLVPTEP